MGIFDKDDEELKEMREEMSATERLKTVASDSAEAIAETDTVQGAKNKANDNPTRVTCRACSSELDSTDVQRCPHCGYDADFNSERLMWSLVTGLFAITLVGIPVAVFTYRKAQAYRKRQKCGVTEKHWT